MKRQIETKMFIEHEHETLIESLKGPAPNTKHCRWLIKRKGIGQRLEAKMKKQGRESQNLLNLKWAEAVNKPRKKIRKRAKPCIPPLTVVSARVIPRPGSRFGPTPPMNTRTRQPAVMYHPNVDSRNLNDLKLKIKTAGNELAKVLKESVVVGKQLKNQVAFVKGDNALQKQYSKQLNYLRKKAHYLTKYCNELQTAYSTAATIAQLDARAPVIPALVQSLSTSPGSASPPPVSSCPVKLEPMDDAIRPMIHEPQQLVTKPLYDTRNIHRNPPEKIPKVQLVRVTNPVRIKREPREEFIGGMNPYLNKPNPYSRKMSPNTLANMPLPSLLATRPDPPGVVKVNKNIEKNWADDDSSSDPPKSGSNIPEIKLEPMPRLE
jgi:hypothetical protein